MKNNSVDPKLEAYARIIKGLHDRFTPHKGQVPIGAALFRDECKDIFVEAARSFGKTFLMSYLLWRYAATHPGSENYYFAPFMKQAREIIWAPKILQNFGPFEWINEPNNTEMRIPFKNGSFIKADGSDNTNAYRGVKPKGLIIFDEFKDFREEFYDAFDPNRAAHNAPLIIIGTPPDRECQFTRVRDSYKADPAKRYFHGPTSANPHISKEWLYAKEKELIERGEIDVWQREYLALQVAGGSSKIFPMLTKDIIKPHSEIMHRIARDRKRLEFIWFADPAAASTFAVLFAAYNPYTKELFYLDEIYEQDQARMTVRTIGAEIIKKRDELNPRAQWRQGYDEAATWFMSEMLDNFNEHLEPSQKASNDKESGLTLIKDILLQNKLTISDRCIKTFWEMDNYYKTSRGEIPKVNDHCIAHDQLVSLKRGNVPISEVLVGDMALTRKGYKKVLKAWKSGESQTLALTFSDGKELKCTSEHLIYTKERGFIRADSLRYTDLVVIDTQWKLNSLELNTEAIQTTKAQALETTIDAQPSFIKRLGLDICTMLFGLKIMERFQRDFRYTTLMTIPTITTFQTLNAFQGTSMTKSIGQHELHTEKPWLSQGTWKELEISQKSGMHLQKEKNGTHRMLKSSLEKMFAKRLSKTAHFVIQNIKPMNFQLKAIWLNFVQTNASLQAGVQAALTILLKSAHIAIKSLKLTNMPISRAAQENAARLIAIQKDNQKVSVYDLTIEDEHEFFASGILVHNCIDAARYINSSLYYSLPEKAEPEPPKGRDRTSLAKDFPQFEGLI